MTSYISAHYLTQWYALLIMISYFLMPQISFCCVTTDKRMTGNVLGPPGRRQKEYFKIRGNPSTPNISNIIKHWRDGTFKTLFNLVAKSLKRQHVCLHQDSKRQPTNLTFCSRNYDERSTELLNQCLFIWMASASVCLIHQYFFINPINTIEYVYKSFHSIGWTIFGHRRSQ